MNAYVAMKPGDRVLVVATNAIVCIVRCEVIHDASPGRDGPDFKWQTVPERLSDPLGDLAGWRTYEDEGITWARGWDDETKGALWAAYALSIS